MPAGRRATQIDDLGIKKDKNLPHQILHQDRHHLENNPYPAGLPRSYGECPRMSEKVMQKNALREIGT